MLKLLLKNRLVEFIAMDIKAPLDRYEIITPKYSPRAEDLRAAITLIKNSGIPHMFRTTVVPGVLGLSDIRNIAEEAGRREHLHLQRFSKRSTLLGVHTPDTTHK